MSSKRDQHPDPHRNPGGETGRDPGGRSVLKRPEAAAELSACVCFSMRKTARAVTQLYDSALQSTGLRITQFTILAILYSVGAPRRMGDLARDLVMDRTTLTRNLRPLIRASYLDVVGGADRRERLAQITGTGVDLVEDILPRWRAVQGEVTRLFGDGRWQDLQVELADVVEQALSRHEGGREAGSRLSRNPSGQRNL